ncbi:H(+)/hexose cotransporter 2 [Coccomyxa sp. Obi]|nr:H(+)/hexose cotransporter 2 [Coccomyxa sp. Obi]
MGMGVRASLMSSMITNCVNFCATFVAILTVDRFGRKPLFFVAGITMFIMQTATAALTGLTFTGAAIPQQPADAMIVFICIFVACFAFSWGPLGWLVPSEIHTLETRATGQAVTVFTNFMASFIIGQFFNSMLCKMQFGVFLFFAAFVAIMTVYVWILLPETKGIPVEEIMDAWARIPINPLRGEGKPPVEGKELKQRAVANSGYGKKAGTNGDDYQNVDLRV